MADPTSDLSNLIKARHFEVVHKYKFNYYECFKNSDTIPVDLVHTYNIQTNHIIFKLKLPKSTIACDICLAKRRPVISINGQYHVDFNLPNVIKYTKSIRQIPSELVDRVVSTLYVLAAIHGIVSI